MVEGALMKALAHKDSQSGRVVVRERVARKNYGIDVNRIFDAEKHDTSLK